MNRVAVFAHYDKNNTIQDYVLFYLKELEKVVDDIIFVSDSDIQDKELKKIKDIITFSIVGKHGEYDFGSYKRGYLCAKENGLLENCEELIFANDSCYAPLFPFEEMFSKMSPKDVDFWGATANPCGIEIIDNKIVENKQEHIQSYFMVFKPTVFKSKVFTDFINSIKKEDKKEKIIAYYEVGMSKLLLDNGFKYDVYCELSKYTAHSQVLACDRLIKENKSPFIKRSILLFKNLDLVWPFIAKKIVKKNTMYNSELIKNDYEQNASTYNYIEYIRALRKFFLRIHYKKRKIHFLGEWYDFGGEK